MEQHNQPPKQNWDNPPIDPAFAPPAAPALPFFPTGGKEFLFGLGILILSWLLFNSIFYAGFFLGAAIFSIAIILVSSGFLLSRGHKLTPYSTILLCLSMIIAASFARSNDGFVKFIMFCFMVISANLGLCLLAGQNRRSPKGVLSLLDIPRSVFMLGIGKLPESARGIRWGFRNSGTAGKKSGAVLLGLVIAVPLLAIMIPLLVSADAAFDGLLQKLPDWDFGELLNSVLWGSFLGVFLYVRGSALHHAPKAEPARKMKKGIHPLTVNTVLVLIGLLYLVYLLSQLAYFSGGFSGILPEGFTIAQYARRGFFEMAWLCAINLGIMALSVGLIKKEDTAPLLTRIICLFLGLVTLFLVVSASAKMFLYIGSYGLTRLRVLTQVIIFWLGLTTLIVTVWLFVPRLPYMKWVLILALIMGAATAWADVDTVVARYNVSAYQSGTLEEVDVYYLYTLGSGAIPYIAELTSDADPVVAAKAEEYLKKAYANKISDFREWNFADHIADPIIRPPETETQESNV